MWWVDWHTISKIFMREATNETIRVREKVARDRAVLGPQAAVWDLESNRTQIAELMQCSFDLLRSSSPNWRTSSGRGAGYLTGAKALVKWSVL